MSAALAIFVKTPGLSPVKTRLAAGLGRMAAEDFYRLSALAVGAVARAAQPLITPYWAVAEFEALHHPLWTDFPALWQARGSLADRLHHIHATLRNTHEIVLLCGADAPQLSLLALQTALRRLDQPNIRVVLGPTEDGGFWLFGSRIAISREAWRSVHYSQPDTCEKLVEALTSYGIGFLECLRDVDTIRDLGPLRTTMARMPTLLPAQRFLYEWLDRFDGTLAVPA